MQSLLSDLVVFVGLSVLAVVDRNRLPSTIGVVLLLFVIGPQEWDPVLS